VRPLLSRPAVYSAFQRLMGGRRARARFARDFIRARAGMTVLDLGCGPADILDHLHDVDYWGFDISAAYVERARARFGGRGRFHDHALAAAELDTLPSFDVVLALGLIHHLDDAEALAVIRLAHRALRPGGRLVTADPCLQPGQNPIARFLVSRDRGHNVRDEAAYAALARAVFPSLRAEVRDQAWIPYTHCFMECTRA